MKTKRISPLPTLAALAFASILSCPFLSAQDFGPMPSKVTGDGIFYNTGWFGMDVLPEWPVPTMNSYESVSFQVTIQPRNEMPNPAQVIIAMDSLALRELLGAPLLLCGEPVMLWVDGDPDYWGLVPAQQGLFLLDKFEIVFFFQDASTPGFNTDPVWADKVGVVIGEGLFTEAPIIHLMQSGLVAQGNVMVHKK